MEITDPVKFLAILFIGAFFLEYVVKMSNIMQYLIQISDEFRESYREIDKRVDEIVDKLDLLTRRIEELETRVNPNRDTDSE